MVRSVPDGCEVSVSAGLDWSVVWARVSGLFYVLVVGGSIRGGPGVGDGRRYRLGLFHAGNPCSSSCGGRSSTSLTAQ